MYPKSESSLILNIKDSHFLAGILSLVHLGGMVLVMLIPLIWPARLVLWTLLGLSFYQSLRSHAWRRAPSAIDAIEMDGEGEMSVRFAGKDMWYSSQISSWVVHPWLTLLTLKIESRRWPVSLVVTADAVQPEPFRRWRVALKLHRPPV